MAYEQNVKHVSGSRDTLISLRDRVRAATGPDIVLGHEITIATGHWLGRGTPGYPDGPCASIDAAVALIERALPGWAWKIGTCHVSDDAWLVPDLNHPVHGERLRKEFPDVQSGSMWDTGVDIDRRPAGNVPLALLDALLTVLIERSELHVSEV